MPTAMRLQGDIRASMQIKAFLQVTPSPTGGTFQAQIRTRVQKMQKHTNQRRPETQTLQAAGVCLK